MAGYVTILNGNKGGIGKSAGAIALTEYRMACGVRVVPLDCDCGNPDLAKTYGAAESYNFLSSDGFFDLVNQIEMTEENAEIVINFPAGSNESMKHNGRAFQDALPNLAELIGRPMRVIWVIDNKRDCLESLTDFIQTAPGLNVDIMMNLHHGPEHTFTLFHNSQIRKKILAAGGKIIRFPALAVRVMTAKANDHKTVAELMKILPLGDRIELQRWWKEVKLAFEEAGYGNSEPIPRRRRAS